MIKAKVAFVLFSLCLLFNYILEVDAQTKRRRTPRVPPAAITTPSGLIYLITKKGTGRQPKKGETIIVHYTGMLTNGLKFDSSHDRNEPLAFKLGAGRVIKGWDEGFSNLRVGDHAILIIPSDLAYGSTGAGDVIPPDSKLIFVVEVVDVKSDEPEANADGTGQQNPTADYDKNDRAPAWSPDGSKVAFISLSFPYQSPVLVADPNGGNVRMIAKDLSAFWPCWSADGASIAVGVDNLEVSNIFQIDLESGHRKRLTAGPKMDTQPAISPDGSKLTFQSNRAGNYEIYIMNLR